MRARTVLALAAVSATTSAVGYVAGFLSAATWRGCLFDCEAASGNHVEAMMFWLVTALLIGTGPLFAWRMTHHTMTTVLATVPPATVAVLLAFAAAR